MFRLGKHLSFIRRFSEEEQFIKVEKIPLEEANKSRSNYIFSGEQSFSFANPLSSTYSYEIRGDEFHAVDIILSPGQSVNARSGSLAYMSQNISFATNLHGGIASSFNRSVSGSSVFLTTYSNQVEETGMLMLSPTHPSKIIPLDLEDFGGTLLCHRDSYLCGDVDVKVKSRYVLNPIFGFWGGGFALQQLEGKGVCLISGGGVVVKKTLREDEEVRLSPSSILAFDARIHFKMISISGIRNKLFGQGLFFLMLKGPGDVYIQSMPFHKIADNMSGSLKKYMTSKG